MNVYGLAMIVALSGACTFQMQAQQAIGSVAVQDATVTGDLSVTNNRAQLLGSSTVVARDHTAEITLNRGGAIRVCATSGLHITQSRAAEAQPLMLSLDRGAIEIEASAQANDVIMTPDLRFAVRAAGPLDLHLRVTQNGDTCVENRGSQAPNLWVANQFDDSAYELHPGQHVLFERGSLREVVDNESSPCGCPAATTPTPGTSIADALLAKGGPPAAEQHPFPAAVSQGLAPPPPEPQAPPRVAHAQVSATLGYNSDGSGTIAGTPTGSAVSSTSTPAGSSASSTPPAHGFFHRVGHFFKHLFGG